MINIIGYIGMTLILIAYLIKDRFKLHFIISIASIILLIYTAMINSMPLFILNLVGFVINIRQCYIYKNCFIYKK